jgi:hypothetical protein
MAKRNYTEGTLFLIPAKGGGFGTAVVGRARRRGHAIVFFYSGDIAFKPKSR